MANPKPKKPEKKSSDQTQSAQSVATKAVTTDANTNVMKGFFTRKYGEGENLLTIFKSPRIWGALLGELVGTMLITMLFLTTLGMLRADFVPIFVMFAAICIYVAFAAISGANLNPLITVGMMATRRMSAIRGVLYILAQLVGAWLGFLVLNAFIMGSGTETEMPGLIDASGENFWIVALIELMGAIIIAFCFARALKYVNRKPLVFALVVCSSLVLVMLFGMLIPQSYFSLYDSLVFNPASALMYGIIPTAADNFGQLAGMLGLVVSAYILLPMVGGVIGFYLSDIITRLAGRNKYGDCPECCEKKLA